MKPLFLLVFACSVLFSENTFGQGGWDIGYIHVDSINPSDIGKDVKLDFIGKSTVNPINLSQVRAIVSTQDTSKLLVDEEEMEFIEVRDIHIDWGFYNEQYLECRDYSPNQVIRIYHTVIEELNDTSIKFRVYIEIYNKSKEGIIYSDPRRRCKSLWVKKEELNGLMIRI